MHGALVLFLTRTHQNQPIPPPPKIYICRPATGPIKIDARFTEAAWKNAPYSDDFVDIEGSAKPTPRFRTRVRMLWDSDYLYIGAELEEPRVRASLTQHDSVIFHDNDFEVFFDVNGESERYVELELNALNTTWDLLLARPYRTGGPALNGWDIKGLKTAVHVDGRLNANGKPSKGWQAEIAIPWSGLAELGRRPCPPVDGDQWRINFSRVEWPTRFFEGKYETVPGSHEDNWVWSPQWVVDMHRPEKWGVLQFTSQIDQPVKPKPLDGWSERVTLIRVWEAENAYRRKTGKWTDSQQELGLSVDGLRLYTTPDEFEAMLGNYCVNEQLRLWKRG